MPATASNCSGRDSLLSLPSLSDAYLRGYAIEPVVLQDDLYLGCLQKINEVPCSRDVLGGPDGCDPIVDRLVRFLGGLFENTDLLIGYGVCPVDNTDISFALGDQVQD